MSGIFGPSIFGPGIFAECDPPGTDLWKKYREMILFKYLFNRRTKQKRQGTPGRHRPTIGELIYHRPKARWGST